MKAHGPKRQKEHSTTYPVAGLEDRVKILVDKWGVSHIYASSLLDAFFAQGFNAARDRLWQMDLWRRRGLGLLSEVFGSACLEGDRALRLFLYRGDMQAEWRAYPPDTQRIVTAFVGGVNEYVKLTKRDPSLLPAREGKLRPILVRGLNSLRTPPSASPEDAASKSDVKQHESQPKRSIG